MDQLGKEFFARDTAEVARDLIGHQLVRRLGGKTMVGLIVETEAYLDGAVDLASHSSAGQTKRNESMFDRPGTWYVYKIHTRHCLNLSTDAQGVGTAVLIRAIQPIVGLPLMANARGIDLGTSITDQRRLTSGPGRTCQALSIDRQFDGEMAIDHRTLFLRPPPSPLDRRSIPIMVTPRIGITKSASLPLRFFAQGNLFVSGPAAQHGIPRRNVLQIGSADT